jgi:cytidylate kinase
MIIGIFGKTCTGKSSVADVLTAQLDLSVRHCGDAIRSAAEKLGVTPVDLPSDIHKQLDSETRSLAISSAGLIIDGTFLDYVLEGVPHVLLIQLICSDEVREQRNSLRSRSSMTAAQRDLIDERLRQLLYGQSSRAFPARVIDTTFLTVDEVARAVADAIRGL